MNAVGFLFWAQNTAATSLQLVSNLLSQFSHQQLLHVTFVDFGGTHDVHLLRKTLGCLDRGAILCNFGEKAHGL
jgi:hypothetical protein